MFNNLSAVKNSPLSTAMMIQYAMSYLMWFQDGEYFKYDIHRILVSSTGVLVTIVDKESGLSRFRDHSFSFSDNSPNPDHDPGGWYHTDSYKKR